MRRRESVTHHPPPALQAIDAGPVRTVLEDIYRHLFREAQAAVTQEITQEVAGAVWTDRGDPAASDWDETGLTADSAWHDLDLSSIVGAGARLVLLRVVLLTGAGENANMYFRENGNSNEINVSAVLEESDNQARDVWVQTDASGVIEYKLTKTGTPAIDVTVGGWWS